MQHRRHPRAFDTIVDNPNRQRRSASTRNGPWRILLDEVLSDIVDTECISQPTNQGSHDQNPKTDKEDNDQNNDRPLRNVLIVPQVAPASTAIHSCGQLCPRQEVACQTY
jgi:hypothetical protein